MLFNVWTQDQVKRMPRQLYLAVRESSEVEDNQNESTVFLFLFFFSRIKVRWLHNTGRVLLFNGG